MKRQAEAPRHPRYEILRKLGSGGSSSVYLAEDRLDDGRRVALKVGRARLGSGELREEFRILRELRHPGIARSFDFGRIPSTSLPYFTLEHISGPDLEEESTRLRRRGSPEDISRLGSIFLDVVDALAYLHGKKLLHLDLKPSNVVFSGDRPKLIDFGLFQAFEMEGRRFPRGTAYYAAPEVFAGASLDARSDLYSLGVMLYRSFTGRHPITGRTLEEVAEKQQSATPLPPRGVPEGVDRIIMKLLAKAPERRFQDAAEVRAALREVFAGARRIAAVPGGIELEWADRRKELSQVFGWFDSLARGGKPGVILVQGEAGMGKSRFLEACTTEALSAGFRVVPLRLTEGEDTNWLKRLLEKVLVLDPFRAGEQQRHRFLLTSVGLSSDAASIREIADLSLDQARSRVFGDALELIGPRAQSPLLVTIDDFHLAGPELVDFVKRLWRGSGAESAPVRFGILLGSRRSADVLGPDPLPGVSLGFRLGPLEKEEARAALSGVDGLTPADARAIVRAARGVPARLADAAEELRRGRFPARKVRAAAAWRLPESLSRPALDLYTHAAILERPAQKSFLAELLKLGPGDLDLSAAELEADGLLREDASGRLHVCHENAGERLRAVLDPTRIAAAHAAIGSRLIGMEGRRREAALHLLRGGRAREGVRTALDVGRELKTTGRVEEGLRLLEEALSRASDPGDRLRLLEECGELRVKLGQFDEASAAFRAVLDEAKPEAARLTPLDRLRILRRLGGVEQRRGNNDAARRVFGEALELLDSTQSVGEHLDLFNEISALYLFLGDFSKASTFANRGLELLNTREAAELDPGERAYHALNLHSAAGHILLRQFEYDRARKEFQRGLELSERVGSMSNTALILNNLGIAYHQSNRLSSALRVYGRAAALARRMGDGTATFSILCNLATIRARLGEIRASEELFQEVGAMPQAAQSSRARLFYLHSRGLTERIQLEDSGSTWEESTRLADALPDPLFARYGRMYLFENEVHQGRWKSARRLGSTLASSSGGDARYLAAVHTRLAWFEAALGNAGAARALLREQKASREKPGCNDLWDSVYHAAALVELDEIPAAIRMLEDTKAVFDASRQVPAAMECAIRIADAELRRRDLEAGAEAIQEARRLLGLHDSSHGSRAARAWIPFLEARHALLSGRAPASHAADRLADAAANLRHGSTWEIGWLMDLTAAAHGIPGAARRLRASRSRFAALLDPPDRKAYLARDHEARLGLRDPRRVSGEQGRARDDLARIRYEALASLRRVSDPRAALDLALRGAGSRKGAIFLEGGSGAVAIRGFRGGERKLRELREAAVRAGSGRVAAGVCSEIAGGGRQRLGVLYVEPSGDGFDAGLEEFLDAAGMMIAGVLPRESSGVSRRHAPRPEPLRDRSDRLLETREALRTRALEGPLKLESASPRMREVIMLIHRTRDSQLPVLLVGESGTGKDYLAQQIHLSSTRARGPFVAQDCSAIPLELMEAEVFGYEEGAFTGADRSRTGYLFTADGGTFYLDNVDSMPLDLQAKLLRVLEDGGARPLGSRRPRKLDVRFIASSQRDLRDHAESGEFRKDLYFRLAGITIHVPPLRERAEDLPRLVQELQRPIQSRPLVFTPAALDALKAHPWPGNVRELESVIRRLALTCEGSVDGAAVARILGVDGSKPSFPRWVFEGRTYRQALDDLKREYLLWLFEKHGGDMDRVAADLGMSKRNVYVRFSQAGIRPVDLRRA